MRQKLIKMSSCDCSLGKINSVALVEDSGGYSGVLTAAHEVNCIVMMIGSWVSIGADLI